MFTSLPKYLTMSYDANFADLVMKSSKTPVPLEILNTQVVYLAALDLDRARSVMKYSRLSKSDYGKSQSVEAKASYTYN